MGGGVKTRKTGMVKNLMSIVKMKKIIRRKSGVAVEAGMGRKTCRYKMKTLVEK